MKPSILLATGFGVGLNGPAPGTLGALWGLPLAWGLAQLPGPWGLIACIGLVLVGGPLCTAAARELGGTKDPQAIVWDEFTTVALVMLAAAGPVSWWWLVAFGLHRLFDITKPWPCRALEKLPDGWGIMADDVMAAGYASLVLVGLRLVSSQ
jgi:phosphatidylglycerophosphatase A